MLVMTTVTLDRLEETGREETLAEVVNCDNPGCNQQIVKTPEYRYKSGNQCYCPSCYNQVIMED